MARDLSRVPMDALEQSIGTTNNKAEAKPAAASAFKIVRAVDTFQDTDTAGLGRLGGRMENRKHMLKVVHTMQRKLVAERRRGSSKYSFLTILALLGAIFALFHDSVSDKAVALRARIKTDLGWYGVFPWVISSVCSAALAAACTKYISAAAAGSGVPEMKVVLAGTVLRDALTKRAFIGRYIGLFFAQFAGIPVGKEGPFMHLMVVVSHHLMKVVPLYRRNLYEYSKSYMELLLAGLVCGSVSNFGTPIAGVIVSIELMCVVYNVSNLAKGFYVATMVLLFIKILRHLFYIASLSDTQYVALFYNEMPSFAFGQSSVAGFFSELAVFFALGCFCGILGALLVKTVQTMIRIRLKYFRQYHFQVVMVWAFVNSIIAFYVDFLRGGNKKNTQDFFSSGALAKAKWGTDWEVVGRLLVWVLYNWFMMAVMLVMPIPCGVFGPLVALGAGLGRLVGEFIRLAFGYELAAGVYAVVGCAAMTSGLTRTLALAVMALELTAQMGALLPVLLAVVCSVFIGNWFNMSIFDTIIELRKLPYLDLNVGREFYAQDVMQPALIALDINASLDDVIELLGRQVSATYLLVERDPKGVTPPVLLGAIKREHLLSVLQYASLADHPTSPHAPPGSTTTAYSQRTVNSQMMRTDQKKALDFYAVVYTAASRKEALSPTQAPLPAPSIDPTAGVTVDLPHVPPHHRDGGVFAPAMLPPMDHFQDGVRGHAGLPVASDAAEQTLAFDGYTPTTAQIDEDDDDMTSLAQKPSIAGEGVNASGGRNNTSNNSVRIGATGSITLDVPPINDTTASAEKTTDIDESDHPPAPITKRSVPFQVIPMQVHPLTPVTQVQQLMAAVGNEQLVVTHRGFLYGVITKAALASFIHKVAEATGA